MPRRPRLCSSNRKVVIRAAKQRERKPLTTAKVIETRLEAVRFRADLAQLILRIVIIAAIAWVLLAKVFLIAQVKGQDMFPAVKDGDLMVAFRLQKEYVKDDVVVYTVDGQQYVGRIAANENDNINLDETGTVTVNGTVQGGEIIYPTYGREPYEYPFHVPEGHVFILGDNRLSSRDSRDFGPIPYDQVQGKVITILRRREL